MALVAHSPRYRLVGRIIPVDGPDDPEHPVFIEIPLASLITEAQEEEVDIGAAVFYSASVVRSYLQMDEDSKGVCYTIMTQSPPEGYFPTTSAPAGFDF